MREREAVERWPVMSGGEAAAATEWSSGVGGGGTSGSVGLGFLWFAWLVWTGPIM